MEPRPVPHANKIVVSPDPPDNGNKNVSFHTQKLFVKIGFRPRTSRTGLPPGPVRVSPEVLERESSSLSFVEMKSESSHPTCSEDLVRGSSREKRDRTSHTTEDFSIPLRNMHSGYEEFIPDEQRDVVFDSQSACCRNFIPLA